MTAVTTPDVDITDLLAEVRRGDPAAWDCVVGLVYADLRRVAHRQMAAQPADHTLGTTGLVHECYLRMARAASAPQDRNHFFALASRVMRQVLVDHARERLAEKQGGGAPRTALPDVSEEELTQAREFVALDDALGDLERVSQRQARVVEARFFAGLTEQETADALGISLRVVQREWHEARRRLYQSLAS